MLPKVLSQQQGLLLSKVDRLTSITAVAGSTLILTSDGTDQTLTGSLGALTLIANSGVANLFTSGANTVNVNADLVQGSGYYWKNLGQNLPFNFESQTNDYGGGSAVYGYVFNLTGTASQAHTIWQTSGATISTIDRLGNATWTGSNFRYGSASSDPLSFISQVTSGTAKVAFTFRPSAAFSALTTNRIFQVTDSASVEFFGVRGDGLTIHTKGLVVSTGKELQLYNIANTFYSSFKSGVMVANYTYTLPLVGSIAGYLSNNGSDTLSWETLASLGANPTNPGVNLTGSNGSASTFLRSDAVLILDQSIVPTWTGVHTFSLQDIHNAGLSLGTSGVLTSAIVAGATTYQYEMQDTNAISLTGFFMRFRNTNSSSNILEITRDGRYSFGWNAQTQLGHVLFFLANDSTLAIAGSPVTAGINASVMHNNAAESPARHWGLVGVQGFGTATGFTPALSGAVLGVAVASPDTLMAGKVHASFVGRFQNINNVNNNESASIDRSLTSAAHYRAGVDHLTVDWADCANASGSVNYPTAGNGIPAICSSARLPIQDYACGITAGAPFGELWAIRGQTKQGTIVMKPLITGYIFMTYPRRTSEATTRAMHAHWEPWAVTSTIRGNAAVGDTYFDDGTNAPIGLHEAVASSGTSRYEKLLRPTVLIYYQDDIVSYNDEVVLI